MLITDMRKRVEEIDKIVLELMTERAELSEKIEESDKFWNWQTKHISQQMNDWWENLQRSQKKKLSKIRKSTEIKHFGYIKE